MTRPTPRRCPPSYEPTQREIREACQRFQAEWKDWEWERRRMGPDAVPWQVQTAEMADYLGNVRQMHQGKS